MSQTEPHATPIVLRLCVTGNSLGRSVAPFQCSSESRALNHAPPPSKSSSRRPAACSVLRLAAQRIRDKSFKEISAFWSARASFAGAFGAGGSRKVGWGPLPLLQMSRSLGYIRLQAHYMPSHCFPELKCHPQWHL